MCGEVVGILKENGITHRSNKDIRTKICELERSFREATDWLAQTGQGIRDNQGEVGETTIRNYLSKICRNYDILAPIMLDRPSSRPQFTNEISDDTLTSATPSENGYESESFSSVQKGPLSITDTNKRPMSSSIVQKRPLSISGTNKSKMSSSILDSWESFNYSSQIVEEKRIKIEIDRADREMKQFGLEEKKIELECKKMESEVAITRINAIVAKALARKQLADAGISSKDIDKLLDI